VVGGGLTFREDGVSVFFFDGGGDGGDFGDGEYCGDGGDGGDLGDGGPGGVTGFFRSSSDSSFGGRLWR
jgi:hypothetical protein